MARRCIKSEDLTDSMRMYRWGVEGGKPAALEIGVAPEWFYKGTGICLRAHNEPLTIPEFANDGGEEPEIAVLWSRRIHTGEETMSHHLANLDHHHFKFDAHRRTGDMHVHFFGAGAFSFGEGIRLQPGDVMQVHFEGFGRPLRNPLERISGAARRIEVRTLAGEVNRT
jgi:hypothetical protein